MTEFPSKYATVNEVCELLRISRRTLHRMVYERRCIQAYSPPGSVSGRLRNGKRRPNKLLFKREDIEAMLKPVHPDSERAQRMKNKLHKSP